ncbi:MAG: NAD(P)-dependent oxidoreductase [Candidatus Latescibacterota bacterium]
MRQDALLINTCRGPVVDEKALLSALQNKQLLGAGLDVTETEPIETDNPLPALPNVLSYPPILQPKAASPTKRAHSTSPPISRAHCAAKTPNRSSLPSKPSHPTDTRFTWKNNSPPGLKKTSLATPPIAPLAPSLSMAI